MDIKVIPNSDDYRDGWDRIWGKRESDGKSGGAIMCFIWPGCDFLKQFEEDKGSGE